MTKEEWALMISSAATFLWGAFCIAASGSNFSPNRTMMLLFIEVIACGILLVVLYKERTTIINNPKFLPGLKAVLAISMMAGIIGVKAFRNNLPPIPWLQTILFVCAGLVLLIDILLFIFIRGELS